MVDHMAGVVTVATIAIPSFVMAVYALLIFAVTLRWLPPIGAGYGFWDGLIYLILPAFATGIGWVGYISRLVRASMLETLGKTTYGWPALSESRNGVSLRATRCRSRSCRP
ncbi:hypothetical protein NKI25_35490 [Mesorhizobium sp. M0808]